MRRVLRYAGLGALALAAFVFFNNADLLARPGAGRPTLLAHRGVSQTFDPAGLTNDTCTARRIRTPTHAFIENTIASMRASFAAGADIVEIDVHPTTDGGFAVFHDWALDCRTDGHGVTRDHAMAELKRLDVGYGYTADGGRTFPLRGKGVGLMPSLDEVLATFPDRRFLINVKSNDPAEGAALAARLGRLAPARREQLMVYGGDAPVAAVKQRLPEVRTASKASLKTCLGGYVAVGWTGRLPRACRGEMIVIPSNVAPWLWGWPNRLVDRMRSAGSEVFILGPYAGGGFSSGIDTPQQYAGLPSGFSGGVWTNEIETIGRLAPPGELTPPPAAYGACSARGRSLAPTSPFNSSSKATGRSFPGCT
jgi:glycerophosphoryl diester phosphodiesterase